MFEILIVKVLVPAALMRGLLKRLELKRRMEEGPTQVYLLVYAGNISGKTPPKF